ncbi:MAG TPA: hypothetical protein VGN32_14200, partial [Ktedonobacterales bacterium]|nr:hypothetical protein [Ktedonobacterales bacterium]
LAMSDDPSAPLLPVPATASSPTPDPPIPADAPAAAALPDSIASATQPATAAHPPLDPLASQERGQGERSLGHRIWQLFCTGGTFSSIARDLHIDRQTATRHVRAIQAEQAEAEQEIFALARLQAVHAQLAIQRAAWAAYEAEVAHEEDYLAASQHALDIAANAAPRSKLDPDWLPPGVRPEPQPCAHPPYRAQRARLLALASTASLRAARLQGLLDRPTAPPPASSAPNPPPNLSSDQTPTLPGDISPAPVTTIPSCTCACHSSPITLPTAPAPTSISPTSIYHPSPTDPLAPCDYSSNSIRQAPTMPRLPLSGLSAKYAIPSLPLGGISAKYSVDVCGMPASRPSLPPPWDDARQAGQLPRIAGTAQPDRWTRRSTP